MKTRACVYAIGLLALATMGAPGGPLRVAIDGLRSEPITEPITESDMTGPGSASSVPVESEAPLADRLRAMFDEAIAAGETSGDELARAYLDAAALVAGREDLDASAEFFREADLWGDGRDVRARARFNYAQVRFRQARQEMMSGGLMDAMQGMMGGSPSGQQVPDIEAVKARLLDAANAFRAVLDVDPRDTEAARHIERVRRMIRTLEEQQEQQQQDQQQDGDESEEDQQGEDGKQDDQQQEGEQPSEQPGEPQGEEESESDRISDWLLEREERQREQRDRQLRALRGRPVPVERDW